MNQRWIISMAVLGSTSLTGCNSIPDFIASGSLMLFQQTAAPTSWTKQTTHDNKALRVVSGTATPGGSTAFTSVFTSRTPAGSVSVSGGSVGNTTLTTPQIPSHSHPGGVTLNGVAGVPWTGALYTPYNAETQQPYLTATATGGAGGNGAHTHPFTVGSASFTGTALDFAVQYVDLIIASKS